MKSYFFLIYINYIGVYSKNYIIYLPAPNSRRIMDKVMWRVMKPLRIVSGAPNRGIELHLLMNPHSNLVHTPTPKTQDQKTFPIARAIAVTRSLPGTSLNETLNITDSGTVKKLASKEDLLKALNELAEKRNTLHKCSNNDVNQQLVNTILPNHNTNEQKAPIIISALNQANGKTMKANNLDEVLEILKKGVTLDRIPEPTTTENVHWMRIKIPKTRL